MLIGIVQVENKLVNNDSAHNGVVMLYAMTTLEACCIFWLVEIE